MIRSDPEDEARPGAQARMLAWLLRLVGLLPLRWTHALGAVLGQAVYLGHGRTRRTVDTNLRLCFPELDAAARHPECARTAPGSR